MSKISVNRGLGPINYDGGAVFPVKDNVYDFGTPANRWKGLYMGSGILYINDTANTGMTTGITINQGAADDQIIALKSSDVAHGFTSLMETDTYAYMAKSEGAGGGLAIWTATDADATIARSFLLLAASGIALDTTKSTAGRGAIELQAGIGSGTTWGAITANGNLFAIRSITTGAAAATVAIVDEDGDLWLNGGITTGAAKVFINETADTEITTGLCINQGDADDYIIGLKSSDVAHGMTGAGIETDSYGLISKSEGVSGGLKIFGVTDADATYATAIRMLGASGIALDTTKSSAGRGGFEIQIGIITSTNWGAITADGNLFAIRSVTTSGTMATVAIVDEDGDLWLNGALTLGAAGTLTINSLQVVGARQVDARIDDTPNSGDVTTDGIIAAIQTCLQTHGLMTAA